MLSIDFGNSHQDLRKIANSLSRFSGSIRSTKPVLEEIRDVVAIPSTSRNFRQGHKRFAVLAPDTYFMPKRDKLGGGPPLTVTGNLHRSATAKVRWVIDGQAASMRVPSGTFAASNAKYGRYQHEGGENPWGLSDIPPRRFYGFDPEDVEKARLIIERWMLANLTVPLGMKGSRTTIAQIRGGS